ncbi:MAG: radical SAM protein [Firmicutes bacterium]|nr:radical SAM protein [Bacillota bacterium]
MDESLLSLENCKLCPRKCGVDRTIRSGYCGVPADLRLAKAMIHEGEEPCLLPAGAVFFSGCNLRCVFCQNYEISLERKGFPVSGERFAEILLELQEAGASTIDLVTPTPWVIQIANVLRKLRQEEDPAEDASAGGKLRIPVVYNCGGYESVEALQMLDGLVDIYMPDLKYFDPFISRRYSGASDYFDVCSAALTEMYRQVGPVKLDEETGRMKKGLLIRHLVLPGCYQDSVRLMQYLGEAFPSGSIRISLLAQYTPYGDLTDFPELRRRVTTYEYEKVVEAADKAGLPGYRQFRSSATMDLRPSFDGSGLGVNLDSCEID